MIRLGKDKVDERFNILADGTIVDLQGNVQELKTSKGRFYFEGVKTYQIQMWTNFGYRDTKKWAIHHKDQNPLNNSIYNLVFMTRSEHTKLHWKGKKFSEEHIKNLSKSHIGSRLSKETLTKLHFVHLGNEITKGRIWVNNGIENKMVYKDQIPNGFKKGRLYIKNK